MRSAFRVSGSAESLCEDGALCVWRVPVAWSGHRFDSVLPVFLGEMSQHPVMTKEQRKEVGSRRSLPQFLLVNTTSVGLYSVLNLSQ